MMTSAMAAPIISGVAVFLLWRVWSQMLNRRWLLLALILVLVSPWLMQREVGLEFAIAYSLLLFSQAGWIFVGLSREHKPPKIERVGAPPLVQARWGKGIALFLLAGPVALIAAVTWTLMLSRLLPVSEASQMVTAAFLQPVVWAFLMAWVCMQAGSRSMPWAVSATAGLGLLIFVFVPGA